MTGFYGLVILVAIFESRIRLKREHSRRLKSITWFWQWEEMAKKLKTIERHKQTFTLALQGDVATKALAIQDAVIEVHAVAKEGRDTINEVHTLVKEGRDAVHTIQRDLHMNAIPKLSSG
jgi:hypothetical protein